MEKTVTTANINVKRIENAKPAIAKSFKKSFIVCE